MRIARFSLNDKPRYAFVQQDPADGKDYLIELDGYPFGAAPVKPTGERYALDADGLRLLAPVIPSKVYGLAKNYEAHAQFMHESGHSEIAHAPEDMVIFSKPSTSVIGPDDPIVIPSYSNDMNFEPEVAVIMGRIAKNVPVEKAMDYVLGFTCVNDVTLRDLQGLDPMWTRAKGFDTSCPLGPWIQTELDWKDAKISFTLNGIVFVLLGTQLPRAMQTTWSNVAISNWTLLIYVLTISLILIAVRFVWVLLMERVHHRHVAKRNEKAAKEKNIAPEPRKSLAHDVHSAAIMTLGGPKGTVTLAVILTIPQAIAQRQLILFLACGVIVVTLLLATFMVPILAPQKKRDNTEQLERDVQANLDILRVVIEELSARQTPETRAATQIVVRQYNDRIKRIKELNGIEDEPNMKLRLRTLAWEREFARNLIDADEVDRFAGYQYLMRLARMEELIMHQHSMRANLRQHFVRWRTFGRRSLQEIVHKVPGAELSETTQATRALQIKCYEHVVDKLHEELAGNSPANAEDISKLLIEYQRLLRTLRAAAPSITKFTTTQDKSADVERLGLEIELEQIQTHYDDGELSRVAAKRLRENVNLMQMDLEDNV